MSDYGGDDGGFGDDGYEYVHSSLAPRSTGALKKHGYDADADVKQWRRHRLR
jgi:hypothetical protein